MLPVRLSMEAGQEVIAHPFSSPGRMNTKTIHKESGSGLVPLGSDGVIPNASNKGIVGGTNEEPVIVGYKKGFIRQGKKRMMRGTTKMGTKKGAYLVAEERGKGGRVILTGDGSRRGQRRTFKGLGGFPPRKEVPKYHWGSEIQFKRQVLF